MDDSTPDLTPEQATKRCSHCGREFPATPQYFVKHSGSNDGLRHQCKQCISEAGGHTFKGFKPVPAEGMRICTICQTEYPATAQYFYKRSKPADRKMTLSSRCKRCAAKRAAREFQGFDSPFLPDGTKRCPQCQRALPFTNEFFSKKPNTRRGLSSTCKDCERHHIYRWREQNLPAINARRRGNYRSRFAADPSFREAKRRYGRANWRKYRLSGLVTTQRYLARKRSLPATFTQENWNRALVYFGGCCAVCGRPPGLWHTLAMDHWISLSAENCPGTVPGNIVPLCHGADGCNNSKGNRNAAEWLEWKCGKRKAAAILARIDAYFDWLQNQNEGGD